MFGTLVPVDTTVDALLSDSPRSRFGSSADATAGTTRPLRRPRSVGIAWEFVRGMDHQNSGCNAQKATCGTPRATSTTAIDSIDGKPLDWDDTGAGMRLAIPAPAPREPVVVVMQSVAAREVPSAASSSRARGVDRRG